MVPIILSALNSSPKKATIVLREELGISAPIWKRYKEEFNIFKMCKKYVSRETLFK